MLKKFGAVKAAVLLASAGYTANVVVLNNDRHIDESAFQVGTTNYQIIDELQTGDIVLFSRKWYHYHIPVAIYISLYQSLFSQFDHCGVILVDQRGEPFILENTPFKGQQMRRLDHRIINSKCKYIAAHGLLPRDVMYNSKEQISLIDKYQGEKVNLVNSSNEMVCQYKSIGQYLLHRLFSKDEEYRCCNINWLLSFYGGKLSRATTEYSDESFKTFCLQNIVDQRVKLLDAERKVKFTVAPSVMIRS